MDLSRRSFMIGSGAFMAAAGFGFAGLGPAYAETTETDEEAATSDASEEAAEAEASAEPEVDNTIKFDAVDVESATADDVKAAIAGGGAMLVDARPWESYAGWALEGAAKGGHLKGAKLFSNRWIDCEYAGETPRAKYLERELADQGIADAKDVIVYDYTGEQAKTVAQYFVSQGIKSVKIFKANELIDEGSDLESYKNYRMFIPTEIVKSISDVKTGKEKELSDAAKEIVGDRIDKVVLIDVSWGNAGQSGYYSVGHVPGSVHINTDSYERPRVYVAEKRSEYAKEWRKIPLQEFKDEVCTQYGITKDSICILSSDSTTPHARLGTYLISLGVETYVMVGGVIAWRYNGYELDTDPKTLVVPESVDSFGSDEINDIEYTTDMVKEIMAGKTPGQIVDERPENEHNGEYSGYGYHDLAGHVEGDIWCCGHDEVTGDNFAEVDGSPRTKEAQLAFLEKAGLDTSIPMVFYCGDSWGATKIAYWCNSIDIDNAKTWTTGWIPWSNTGEEFIDHKGNKLHYDKYRDTVVDADGKDMRDGVNILDDAKPEE